LRAVTEVPDEVGDLLGEPIEPEAAARLERAGRELVAPGRAPDAEVDAPGEERLEHPKALCDLERAVVAQHDPARAHPEV
jgi:hypothetical protein